MRITTAIVLTVLVSLLGLATAKTKRTRRCIPSAWSEWSECSDYGERQRIRYCYGGCCYGELSEKESCEKKKESWTWNWYGYGRPCSSYLWIGGAHCCCYVTSSGYSCGKK